MTSTKSTHGGARPGAGRKPLAVKRQMWCLRVLPDEKDFLKLKLKEYRASKSEE